MKSHREKSKKLPVAKRREVAEWVVKYPDMTIVQIAYAFGIKRQLVYKIIGEYIDVKKTLTLKARAPTEAQEKPKPGELPQ